VAGERRTSGIVTPEAVLLEFETAGVASRALARLIDLFLQVVLLGMAWMVLGLLLNLITKSSEGQAVLVAVLSFAAIFGYPVLLEARTGRTPGKTIIGLRVVTREGAPGRFRHAAIRAIVAVVEVFAFTFIAIFTTAFSPANQRVGDLMAGTIVVRQRSAARQPVALQFPPPRGWEDYARRLDVSTMTVGQYRLIRSFLTRVLVLTPRAREKVALRLANPLARAMRHQPPPQLSAELFLVCAASAYQVHHAGALPLASETGLRGPNAETAPAI
jgi:uncharacterized RDD family membrane protein YckC